MPLPSWNLPEGVTRSVWEYAHDPQISQGDAEHLRDTPLAEFDLRQLDAWLPAPTRPTDVIDLGCGPGRVLVPLARRGFRMTGVDLSPTALAMTQASASEAQCPVRLVRANLCDLSCLDSGSHDIALLLFGTLGMIAGHASRERVLREAARLLRPSGVLLLHAHNVWAHLWHRSRWLWLIQDRLRALRNHPQAGDTHRDYRGIPGMYHHGFTLRELTRLLRATGFSPRNIVPLATNSQGQMFSPAGLFQNLRANGWLIRAVIS